MRNELLPGVTAPEVPPAVVCDARAAIRSARRRAIVRDALVVALLACVDYLFFHFHPSHIPMLDRAESLKVLQMLNVALLTHLWLQRAVPRWMARRVASTWCRQEQAKFFVD
jgi:hypothetical protein